MSTFADELHYIAEEVKEQEIKDAYSRAENSIKDIKEDLLAAAHKGWTGISLDYSHEKYPKIFLDTVTEALKAEGLKVSDYRLNRSGDYSIRVSW